LPHEQEFAVDRCLSAKTVPHFLIFRQLLDVVEEYVLFVIPPGDNLLYKTAPQYATFVALQCLAQRNPSAILNNWSCRSYGNAGRRAMNRAGRGVLSTDGTRSFSYPCGDCPFFVGPNRVSSSEDGLPGALVHLTNDGKQLEITCRSSRSRVIIFRGDEAEMKTGGSLTIPGDSHAAMLFN
jgi:hypothetical protein